jgi:hypothetical protein
MMQRSCALRRATTRHIPAGDAVEVALDRDAARLSYPVCSFAHPGDAHDLRGKEVQMSDRRTIRQVRSFGGGRVCVAAGCGTILSAYNPASWCAVHDRLSPRARKGHGTRRPTDSRACANPTCGMVFESANTKRQYCSDTCRAMAFYARQHRDEETNGAR